MSNQSSQHRPSLMEEAFSWEVGMTFRVGGTICRVEHLLQETKEVVLKSLNNAEERVATFDELGNLKAGIDYFLIDAPRDGEELAALLAANDAERIFLRKLPLDDCSPAEIRQVFIKMRWLLVLHRAGYHQFRACDLWEPDILALAKKNDLEVISAETLAKWEAELRAVDSGVGLIPRYKFRGGKGQTRCDPTAVEIVVGTIEEARRSLLLTLPGKIPLKIDAVTAEAKNRINTKNKDPKRSRLIIVPSASTISRLFHARVTQYESDVMKHGRTYADRKHKPTGRRPTIDFPGGTSEFDDLDTKVFCISEKTGLPWGRCWITHGVDQSSDYPVGRSFGPKNRSGTSAVEALVHSIEPKEVPPYILGPDGRPLRWLAQGYPVQALFDNALYNNLRIVSLGADVADPAWARSREPTDKRAIEYHNGRVVDFLSTLEGWRGPKDDPEAIKHGLATALMTAEQVSRALMQWELSCYVKQPMKDGRTPEEKYAEVGQLQMRPRMPPDVRRLRLLRMLRCSGPLTWTRNGIRTMGLTYNDPDLYRMWINRAGGSMKVYARIDPWNLSFIYIDVPGTELVLEIPCLEEDYVAGLTLYQHQLVRKLCAQLKRTHPGLADLYEARHQLREMMAKWEFSGKVSERKKAAKTGPVSESKSAGKSTNNSEAVHDAEKGCDELDAVEMDQSDIGWSMPEYA
ncbi:Mu transposase C-terminal domain-containing protein [Variovorax sp. J22R115]|uniref:Mu transposase C-terminal domain-containing protein n=1 Tax=Variovorax sp. J22R115 TaxID=3053509 RepID=UPI002577CCC0|nr:Mu transposase C-terminal domain-containing protein [Variovorax sp. J22R115]MDM0053984.1 Mu transposase C-terminal domain-containing protein [Variovorax sp. J22R115]